MACNNWQSQPRDPETGRWANRAYWEPRRQMIKIRLTYRERQMIEQAASASGQSMTEYIVEACRDHQPRRRPPAETHQQRLAKRLPQNRGRR